MKRITEPASRARAAVLVDKLLGYPLQPTHRGANCPPPPFGVVMTHARENEAADGTVEYPFDDEAVTAALADSRGQRLTGQERAELAALNAAAAPGQARGRA